MFNQVGLTWCLSGVRASNAGWVPRWADRAAGPALPGRPGSSEPPSLPQAVGIYREGPAGSVRGLGGLGPAVSRPLWLYLTVGRRQSTLRAPTGASTSTGP